MSKTRKWPWPYIVVLCVCLALLATGAIGTNVFGWCDKLNTCFLKSQAGAQVGTQIGSAVGPGEGPIVFPLGKGKTRVEATAKVTKLPAINTSLTATKISKETITGEVIWVGCVQKNRAVATVVTINGLVTVGLKF